ncbi:MAG: hypothetical protein QOH49_88 [Acidobacteriota bacterium]|jgi:hypothetical protein|nr:hypothetical protein [Acidobacteriota bacterium]
MSTQRRNKLTSPTSFPHRLFLTVILTTMVAVFCFVGATAGKGKGAPPTPPTVSITNPVNATTFVQSSTIMLEVTAADPDAGGSVTSVEYFDGATSLGTSTVGPSFRLRWNPLTLGAHTITARATDIASEMTTSAAITITVVKACIPVAFGVPGLAAPPNWFDPAGSGDNELRQELDDPRWVGSFTDSEGDGTQEQFSFRALHGNEGGEEFLYLSWHVKVDPSNLSNEDFFYLGFSGAAGSMMLRVTPFNSQSCRLDVAPVTVEAFKRVGTNWVPFTPPAWASGVAPAGKTRVWSTIGPSGVGAFCQTPFSWAVQMRVPTTDLAPGDIPGLNLGPDFKMWFEAQLITASATLANYKWPRNAPSVTIDILNGGAIITPDPATQWGDFHVATPGDAACALGGVTLTYDDVGNNATFPSPPVPAYVNPSSIYFRPIVSLPQRPVNNMFARPRNLTGQTIAANNLRARFRVANWGSVATPGPWDDIPGGTNVPNSASIAPGAQGTLTFPWVLTDADITKFASGAAASDKCVLVTLRSLGSPSVTFLSDSLYHNMGFFSASKFEHDAELNIAGLPRAPTIGPQRDLYLYVETKNMPAPPNASPTPVPMQGPQARPAGKQGAGARPGKKGLIRPVGTDELKKMLAGGRTSEKELDKVMPTYRVYVYHDTGERVTTKDGVRRAVIEPQPSFGYYMVHDGDIEGWKHDLQGAIQLTPNFYKIAVPEGGKAIVKTIIEAVEPTTTPTPVAGVGNFSVGLRGGVAVPHGNFGNVFDPGGAFTADLEYHATDTFSVFGLFGYRRFGRNFAFLNDLNVFQFSAGTKVYFAPGGVRPFVNVGVGAFKFDPGSTRFGLNGGGGLQFVLTPRFALEGEYNYHSVFTSGSNVNFSTGQGGVRIRF